MREHLLWIDDLYFGRQNNSAAALNISIYQNELVSVCNSSSLCVDFLKEAYKNRKINGSLRFLDEKRISLSKGMPLKHIYSISKNAKLISSLSITDNIFSLRKCSFPHILYNSKYARIAAADLMQELQLPVNINMQVSELSEAEHHLLLLAKAFVCSAKLILLDNIVEFYNYSELQLFLDLVKRLQAKGVSFLIFTNGPSLLTEVSDRIFVTKNYEITHIMYHTEYDEEQLTSMMLGGAPQITTAKKTYMKEETLITLDWSDYFANLPAISLRRQECLCVFNYNGSNIGDIYHSFTRKFPYILDGKLCTSYSSAMKNGLLTVAFSMIEKYFFPGLSLQDNLTLPILRKISTAGIINKKLLKYCISSSMQKMYDKNVVGTGQQIETVLLRWQMTNPKLMVISDFNLTDTERPRISSILNDMNKSGTALVILSSNLYDCLYFADSLLVVKNSSDFHFFHKADSECFVSDVKTYLYGKRDDSYHK